MTDEQEKQPTIILTRDSTSEEILQVAADEDAAIKARHEAEDAEVSERHKSEKKAHTERQKRLKAMAKLAAK